MNIKLLLILNLLTVQFAYAETVYKTRDAAGNIIFSDVETEGAEVIEIQEAQSLSIPKTNSNGSRRTTKLTPKETEYTRFEIISPENNSTVRSNEGVVNANIEILPALDEKHSISFFMNGKDVGTGKAQQLSLTGLDRGTHTITAVVINDKAKIIKHSNKLVFHLRKASVLFNNRENNVPSPTQNSNANSINSVSTTPITQIPTP